MTKRTTAQQTDYMRVWREKNREHVRASANENNRRRRRAVLELLGGRCLHCGFDDPRALQIDHVEDDGWVERHEVGDNHYRKMIAKILRGEDLHRYQLLCANCNWIKRAEREGTFG